REGMDLPEVTFVAILDADREGYLRSYRSLIQIMGRAARNVNSRVIIYADEMTDSIAKAVNETQSRRRRQIAYNKENNITPVSITKSVADLLPPELSAAYSSDKSSGSVKKEKAKTAAKMSVAELERAMWDAVDKLDFERAAVLRDAIAERERVVS
ncbi:MAG: UvrB/UvrC motif-containing protein, partial [Synergistaceae bacterium]|nr:UvrB/UvrC motif-containing protein [Synergistaceae bacterium]